MISVIASGDVDKWSQLKCLQPAKIGDLFFLLLASYVQNYALQPAAVRIHGVKP